MDKNNQELEVMEMQNTGLTVQDEGPRGFDDDDAEDVIIPRIKVIQDLSPERKEKKASEGDLLNSLTKEILNGKNFIPVFKYDNNIKWRDRSLGGGIECRSVDGKVGQDMEGLCKNCAKCGMNKFDNTKKGADAAPLCTAYFNFFGFIEGEHVPMVLSFSKTYYNEGKKMYSMAKFRMQDMWNFKYAIKTKLQSKNDNSWYIIMTDPAGATSTEDRAFALELYKMFKNTEFKADLEEGTSSSESEHTMTVDEDMASEF